MNACIELVKFSSSSKVKNIRSRPSTNYEEYKLNIKVLGDKRLNIAGTLLTNKNCFLFTPINYK